MGLKGMDIQEKFGDRSSKLVNQLKITQQQCKWRKIFTGKYGMKQ